MPVGVNVQDETSESEQIEVIPASRMPEGHVLVRIETPGRTVLAVHQGHYQPENGRMSAELRAAMARHARHAAWLNGVDPEQGPTPH